MLSTITIADEILELKKQRRAILLAHHYQESEIQELADVVGDSLELARKARDGLTSGALVRAATRAARPQWGRAAPPSSPAKAQRTVPHS